MSEWYRGSSIKFDPAEFSVPPSLQKGSSQRLQFYIQSAHARALDIIAHSGHFPWGKDTDVARWCVQFGIQHINKIDNVGGLPSLIRQANIINATNDEELRNLKFLENFDKTQQIVMQLKGMGENEMAKQHALRIYGEIKAMPDEPEREGWWKMKYLNKFESMFADALK